MRFYYRRIQFLPGDVDDVRYPSHDLQRRIVPLEQIVWNKNAVAKLLIVGHQRQESGYVKKDEADSKHI